jgi:hypothetical protein
MHRIGKINNPFARFVLNGRNRIDRSAAEFESANYQIRPENWQQNMNFY